MTASATTRNRVRHALVGRSAVIQAYGQDQPAALITTEMENAL